MEAATEDVNIKPTAILLSPGAQNRKALFQRTFGKLEQGGVRVSLFSLINSAVGAGIFTLPYVFALLGWGLGLILLVVGMVGGIWSSLMLTKMAVDNNLKNYDQITKKASPYATMILSASILLYGPGSGCGNVIIMNTMAAYICSNLGVN